VTGLPVDSHPRGSDDWEERVLLVSMPFGALERPALSLGLLQAHCRRLGVECDTRYLTFAFADQIGLADYLWICSDEVPYTAFVGDWIFSEALYGTRPYADAAYVDEVLHRTWRLAHTDIARLERIRARAEPFLEEVTGAVPWGEYTFVGFTSVFQQNIASLALARRVKQAHPDVTIAFGGANWEDAMGVALLEQFSFVELAFSGEADESFPATLAARANGAGVAGIAGVTSGARARLAQLAPATRVKDLDSVPVPDFDPFFAQLRASPAVAGLTPTLLLETARGCWWGERSHCTFCGLNGATMAFRSKSPQRVLEEIAFLNGRYGVKTVSVVDDILDMGYFESVLPRLAQASLGTEFFWEIKANLTHRHVRALRDAGVLFVQPGIESLSDHVLALMRKGTTAFRNIELLKWCKEYGVKPYWNFLYGFPDETEEDYEVSMTLIEAIWHLDPPTGHGPIRLDRFSPYHADPAAFGMLNVRPMAPFSYLYPFGRRALMDIAYYFDFDYADGRTDDFAARPAIELVRSWMADDARGAVELKELGRGTVELLDTRRRHGDRPRRATLEGWKASVYVACDRAQSFPKLAQLSDVQASGIDASELGDFLERCVRHRLMVTSGRSWLNVAVHTPAREETGEPRAASERLVAASHAA
jgi:ribosomal peptide maturation radical SAM protein 1